MMSGKLEGDIDHFTIIKDPKYTYTTNPNWPKDQKTLSRRPDTMPLPHNVAKSTESESFPKSVLDQISKIAIDVGSATYDLNRLQDNVDIVHFVCETWTIWKDMKSREQPYGHHVAAFMKLVKAVHLATTEQERLFAASRLATFVFLSSNNKTRRRLDFGKDNRCLYEVLTKPLQDLPQRAHQLPCPSNAMDTSRDLAQRNFIKHEFVRRCEYHASLMTSQSEPKYTPEQTAEVFSHIDFSPLYDVDGRKVFHLVVSNLVRELDAKVVDLHKTVAKFKTAVSNQGPAGVLIPLQAQIKQQTEEVQLVTRRMTTLLHFFPQTLLAHFRWLSQVADVNQSKDTPHWGEDGRPDPELPEAPVPTPEPSPSKFNPHPSTLHGSSTTKPLYLHPWKYPGEERQFEKAREASNVSAYSRSPRPAAPDRTAIRNRLSIGDSANVVLDDDEDPENDTETRQIDSYDSFADRAMKYVSLLTQFDMGLTQATVFDATAKTPKQKQVSLHITTAEVSVIELRVEDPEPKKVKSRLSIEDCFKKLDQEDAEKNGGKSRLNLTTLMQILTDENEKLRDPTPGGREHKKGFENDVLTKTDQYTGLPHCETIGMTTTAALRDEEIMQHIMDGYLVDLGHKRFAIMAGLEKFVAKDDLQPVIHTTKWCCPPCYKLLELFEAYMSKKYNKKFKFANAGYHNAWYQVDLPDWTLAELGNDLLAWACEEARNKLFKVQEHYEKYGKVTSHSSQRSPTASDLPDQLDIVTAMYSQGPPVSGHASSAGSQRPSSAMAALLHTPQHNAAQRGSTPASFELPLRGSGPPPSTPSQYPSSPPVVGGRQAAGGSSSPAGAVFQDPASAGALFGDFGTPPLATSSRQHQGPSGQQGSGLTFRDRVQLDSSPLAGSSHQYQGPAAHAGFGEPGPEVRSPGHGKHERQTADTIDEEIRKPNKKQE